MPTGIYWAVLAACRRTASCWGAPPFYALPRTAASAGTTVLIAICVWHWPFWAQYYGGGPQTAGYVGEATSIDQMRRGDYPRRPWTWDPPLFSALMCILGSIFALGLASQHPREREYVRFGVCSYLRHIARALSFSRTSSLPILTSVRSLAQSASSRTRNDREAVRDYGCSLRRIFIYT